MSDTQTRSRLAAILAADAVGYSRLMSADDRATVTALDAARAIFRKHIQASQGRVVDMAGDSVLAVFETAAGAVSAAIGTQRDLDASMGEVPSDQRLMFRIGVHLGDVIEKDDGTVYGDGVNISARLQALAPAGGVVISDAVRGSVKNRIAARFVDLGKQSVKNIAEPVRAFQVQASDGKGATTIAAPRRSSWIAGAIAVVIALIVGAGWYALHGGLALPSGERTDSKSIAVLPFANIGADKDTTYFADGVHEDLLTQLALLGDLKVISRVSVMDYRDTKKNVRQIGSELGVGSVVEGSVRRAGGQVRVTAQLIDAKSDKHLWAKSYDRELKDVFAIQSELATDIAKSLKVSLEPQQIAQLAKKPTDNPEAYDLLLRHQELVHQTTGSVRFNSTVDERAALLTKAVSLDPNFALAWARLANDHARAHRFTDKTEARLERARQAFERAQALGANDLLVKIEAGTYYRFASNDLPRAASVYQDVLTVAPNNVDALTGLATVRSRQMIFPERVALLERALILDPRNPETLDQLSYAYRGFRQYERSLALRRQLMEVRPGDDEIKAALYYTEFLRNGSWAPYDAWRSTLPRDAATHVRAIRGVDIDRAIARGDLDEALRLIDVDSDDSKKIQESRCACKEVPRVLILRAKGDQATAARVARSAMELAESELKKTPNDTSELWAKAMLHALDGQKAPAFAALAKATGVHEAQGNLCAAAQVRKSSAALHALLGERKEALLELSRQLQFHSTYVHDLRIDIGLYPLWHDANFKALLDNPANNAPISFDTKCE